MANDYDIVTAALPDQVEKLFPHTIPVGKKIGVMVVVEREHQFQIATFRAEGFDDAAVVGEITAGAPRVAVS